MSASLGTTEAAAKIGTTAKLLRKFLRDNPNYGSVGIGGRYEFDGDQLSVLADDFKEWRGKRELAPRQRTGERVAPELAYLNEDRGVDTATMHRAARDPRLRKQLAAKRGARYAKLHARMKEVGVV